MLEQMENESGNVVLSHARPATSCHVLPRPATPTPPPFLTLSLSSSARRECVCMWLFTLSHFHHCVSWAPLSSALLSSSRMCPRTWAARGAACEVGACPSRQLLLNCIILRPLMDDCYDPRRVPAQRPASWRPLSSSSHSQGIVIWQVQPFFQDNWIYYVTAHCKQDLKSFFHSRCRRCKSKLKCIH